MTNTATINPDSPRAVDWIRIFGGRTVPILSPIPVQADGPEGPAEFYRLDLDRLTHEQRERLVDHLSGKFHVPKSSVRVGMNDPDHGVPILAVDVVVPIDARLL